MRTKEEVKENQDTYKLLGVSYDAVMAAAQEAGIDKTHAIDGLEDTEIRKGEKVHTGLSLKSQQLLKFGPLVAEDIGITKWSVFLNALARYTDDELSKVTDGP